MSKESNTKKTTSVTPERLALFEEAIGWEWSVSGACNYSGIPESTYYDHEQRCPSYRRKRKLLQENTKYTAQKNIAQAIAAGDVAVSRWYLERRAPEFSPRTNIDVSVRQKHEKTEIEIMNRLAKFIGPGKLPQPKTGKDTHAIQVEHDGVDAAKAG